MVKKNPDLDKLKEKSADLWAKFWDLSGYKAKEEQLKALMEKIQNSSDAKQNAAILKEIMAMYAIVVNFAKNLEEAKETLNKEVLSLFQKAKLQAMFNYQLSTVSGSPILDQAAAKALLEQMKIDQSKYMKAKAGYSKLVESNETDIVA